MLHIERVNAFDTVCLKLNMHTLFQVEVPLTYLTLRQQLNLNMKFNFNSGGSKLRPGQSIETWSQVTAGR